MLTATYTCPTGCVDEDDNAVDMIADFRAVKNHVETAHICPSCGTVETRP